MIGLALGSGAARGLSHFGVLQALDEAGIVADVVAGTSAGAMVGAAYAAGKIQDYENWVKSISRRRQAGYIDLAFGGGGLIKAHRVLEFFESELPDRTIESLPIRFAAVATDLLRGEEVQVQDGPLLHALRASIAMPAVVAPARMQDRWLVDGALVNPVPVSVCRDMGADVVISVDPSTELVGERFRDDPQSIPSLFNVFAGSIEIMQLQIGMHCTRMHPPDVSIEPRLAHFGRFDFHRTVEAMEEGRRATVEALAGLGPSLRAALGQPGAAKAEASA